MGLNFNTIFFMTVLIVLVLVPAPLLATRTFNTAVLDNGQRYTAPTTTPKNTNLRAAATATASRRIHPPPVGPNNRYHPPAPVSAQRPLYKPPTTTSQPKKCKCDCPVGVWEPVCGKDYAVNDKATFPTKCAMECYSCTHDKRYVVLTYSACT